MSAASLQQDCPFCGGKHITEGKSIFEGSIYIKNGFGDHKPHEVTHIICTSCGSVLNSRIKREALCSCEVCRNGKN